MQEFVWMDSGERVGEGGGGGGTKRKRKRAGGDRSRSEGSNIFFFYGPCRNKKDTHKAKCP